MSDTILRRDRINTAESDDHRKLTTLIDGRISEVIETVDELNGSIVYGYVGVDAQTIFQATADDHNSGSSHISTDNWQGNSETNRALFGNLLAQTISNPGENRFLIQQYIACAGEIQNPLSIFLNNESIRLDGYASQPNGIGNKWQWSVHHFNVRSLTGTAAEAASRLAAAYIPGQRTIASNAAGFSLVTGIYYGRDNFDQRPTAFIILMGQWPAKRLTAAGAVESFTSGTAGNYGLHSCLLDWLTSTSYGPGLTGDDLDATSWRTRSEGGIALTQDSAATALTDRIRAPAYDADEDDPKNAYSNAGSPIPNLAVWPIWGSINTGQTYREILGHFTAACPPLLMWWDLSGKLKANVTALDGMQDQAVDFRVGDDDLLDLPAIDIPETAYAFGSVEIKYREYTEDFRESVFDGTSAVTGSSFNTPGTYQYTVPDGVTEISIAYAGGDGADGGVGIVSNSTVGRAGGAGGTGYTPGTAGGRGGGYDHNPTDASGQGGENRTGTGYTGARIPNGGAGEVETGSIYYYWGGNGSQTDLSGLSTDSSEYQARLGTGGGGGAGVWYTHNGVFEPQAGYLGGGGGGGGGGSSAVLRGATVLVEGKGGLGGGGNSARDTISHGHDRSGTHSAKWVRTNIAVTGGETLTIFVGQGGSGIASYLAGHENWIDGKADDGYVRITVIDPGNSNAERTQESVALCGCKPHARKISRELALRSQLHKIGIRLTRKFLGVEPGDVVQIQTDILTALILVQDRSINPDLTVDVVGLKLLVDAA